MISLETSMFWGLVDYASRRGRISYSESGEDMIVQSLLRRLGIWRTRYIDVGASHPFFGNNTALLYRKGSSGINIEPNPVYYRALVKHRKRDINLNAGVLDYSGEAEFYILADSGLSTLLKAEAERRAKEQHIPILKVLKVKVYTLNEVFARYGAANPPRFVSLDTEGADERILRSFDFSTWSPLVICCETTGQAERKSSLIEFMESQGYAVYADTWVNTIFVQGKALKGGTQRLRSA